MEITVSQEQGRVPVTVVHVKGNLDSTSYEQFQMRVESLIKHGSSNILLDLHDVPYMSSAGLRSLNQLYNQLKDEDKSTVSKGVSAGTYKAAHLKLLSPTKRVQETLKMSGFDMFLESYSNLKDALAAF